MNEVKTRPFSAVPGAAGHGNVDLSGMASGTSGARHGDLRAILVEVFMAGVDAAAPDKALLRHVRLEKDLLVVDGKPIRLQDGESERRIFVLGAGKGAAPMAGALEALLGRRIAAGHVVVKYGHGGELWRIGLSEAAHPVPDAAGERAVSRMLELAGSVRAGDLAICLFTGGASALTPAPAQGVSLADLQRTTRLLLRCGADINELNAVRKHLSRWSGGQLARALAPAEVCALLVSDVVGDDLSVIASGPTAPDASTFADCLRLLDAYHLSGQIPIPVRRRLEAGRDGLVPETPKPDDPVFDRVRNVLVASNVQALEAAAAKAEELGFEARILTSSMTGEAEEQATRLIAAARSLADCLAPGARPVCLLAGGETTVTLRGSGQGGRNQEMALAAALALEGESRITALFAGTDGTDGPTEAAGGFASGNSARAARLAGGDPGTLLQANDSHEALRLSGDLLITGPTRTNVMDLALVLVFPRR